MPEIDTPCPSCGQTDWVLVLYAYTMPESWDGWSEKRCQSCGARIGRWSGRMLLDDEAEMPPWRMKENADAQTR